MTRTSPIGYLIRPWIILYPKESDFLSDYGNECENMSEQLFAEFMGWA